MGIGFSIFLIAVGAILRWGVTTMVHGLNLGTIGWILMAVGAIGLLVSVFIWAPRRRSASAVTYDDGYTTADPAAPVQNPAGPTGHRVVREESYRETL